MAAKPADDWAEEGNLRASVDASAVRFRKIARWLKRAALVAVVCIVLVLIVGELYCRYHLQLGDPPLMMKDALAGVLYKPGVYHRFGHTMSYNAYSMRSGPVTPTKTDPNEIRVLVLGDSVVNGGSMTDDSELATALIQKRLSAELGRPVFVGNISASPWGPPNELGYLKHFGLFDADVVVLVLSSHDYADESGSDVPVGMDSRFPDHRPTFALQELIARYNTPIAQTLGVGPDEAPVGAQYEGAPDKVKRCLDAVKEMAALVKAHHATMLIAQHMEPSELRESTERQGHALLGAAAREAGIEPIQLGPAFQISIDFHAPPYRDAYIHPNATGQQIFADVLGPEIVKALHERPAVSAVP